MILKKLITLFFLSLLTASTNGIAQQLKDIPGYHVLSTNPPGAQNNWYNIDPGTCIGVTFPSPIDSGIPASKNEILIDSKLITSTLSCSTIYATGDAKHQCLVTIEIIVQNKEITKVNLSTTYGNCKASPDSPFILLF